MAGYSWPSSFFKLAKKEQGQYPAILTEETWSIKDLLNGFQGSFSCGIQWVVPSGQDGSILPACGASHIINKFMHQCRESNTCKTHQLGSGSHSLRHLGMS